MIREYKTFYEFYQHYQLPFFQMGWDDAGLDYGKLNEGLFAYLVEHVFEINLPEDSDLRAPIINKLFCQYIAPRNKKMCVVYMDGKYTEDELEEKFSDFMRKYIYILRTTMVKYAKLIELYESNKDKLMDAVKSATESKFNDTPQNIQGTYDWSTDDHLTNVAKSESTNDIGTKMTRINEIERLITDYYKSWANEFKELFFFE